MFVSLNTIKAHTRRLYEKLDVSNRTQAVIRARECHLLDE
jgi:ATP/maltotriose-dependent transcriptional regulator MalT